MSDPILYSLDARGVATLTLNRPELHNAFDDEIIACLTGQLEAIEKDPAVRVLVLTGNGISFSAGADLNWMRRMAGYSHEQNQRDAEGLAQLMQRLDTLRVPVVARVQGSAFGGGAGLVACCDIVVAVSDALFCFSEVKLGLVPAVISPYVIRAIGPRAARRYFITAERFNPGRAQRLGLVHKVVEHHELDATVAGLVEPLLLNGPQAMHAAKQLVAEVTDRRIDSELIALTASRIADVRSSAEGKEGVTAFVEKRRPNWL